MGTGTEIISGLSGAESGDRYRHEPKRLRTACTAEPMGG
jgi:hypothetical protein